MTGRGKQAPWAFWAIWAAVSALVVPAGWAEEEQAVNRTIVAEVLAFDQPFLWNRLGASQPGGMIYALREDVISRDPGGELKPGRVTLRPGKRPRPLVLRANVGDRLRVQFTNLLAPGPINGSAVTRYAGLHAQGLDAALPLGGGGDASWVGKNPNGLAAPGESRTYEFFAKAEGTYLLTNPADNVDNGQSSEFGLFGAINVQPEWSEWYRSQVTREDLIAATRRPPPEDEGFEGLLDSPMIQQLERQFTPTREVRKETIRGVERDIFTLRTTMPDKRAENRTDVVIIDNRLYTTLEQPIVNYAALYEQGPLRDMPVLKMLRTIKGKELFATDPASFPKAKIDEAIEGFNATASRVTDDLRRVFAASGIELSRRVRVTGEQGRAWLLAEPGRRHFLIERVDLPAGASLRVSDASLRIVHSDLTAVITGPGADRFDFELNSPSFFNNPTLPDRRQPYREFTILYHRAQTTTQAFAHYQNANTSSTFSAGQDAFAINYGMAGIGSEVLASRLGVGPMGNADAVDLKFEEFFLSSWAVGDPAMVVDVPANANDQAVSNPDQGLEVEQRPLFTLDEDEEKERLMVALGTGQVPARLLEAFRDKGIDVSGKAFVTAIEPGKQWVILDPHDANGPAAPDRKRYPIVRQQDRVDHDGNVTTTLAGFSGFPTQPSYLTYNGPSKVRATKAYYPDDPSNVYHSNIRDHVKFRILHAGPGPSHVHHLHAHQWLHSPNSAQSQYLDSQLIVPGATYTLEMVYNGSGNRNLTVGDSIFHCHFYPHFAQGMWSLWRTHDVFETGTWLDSEGRPVRWSTKVDGRDVPVQRVAEGEVQKYFLVGTDGKREEVPADRVTPAWNRALPDGEIEAGTPIPAIVPLPSIAMPLKPAPLRLTDLAPFTDPGVGQGRRVEVQPRNSAAIEEAKVAAKANPKVEVPPAEYDNPGYPFFIPGVAGHRPPHPPKDFAWRQLDNGKPMTGDDGQPILLDGGLPRHVVLDGQIVKEYHTRWDFSREFIALDKDDKPVAGRLAALALPEDGTPYEQAAMRHHEQRSHSSFLPNGDPGNITRNGLKAKPGAPYAPPEVDEYGNGDFDVRRYQAAVIQSDVVLNKLGWHYPQQRFLTLWEDVAPTFSGRRAPQPLFFRSNTNDTIEFWHTNLVPAHYELDDFQVRTPTDVIGQHIHNVKFDVTSSDGGANGFNYEDGTFSPDEVRDRIHAIDRSPGLGPHEGETGLIAFNPATGFVDPAGKPKFLTVIPVKDAYPIRGGTGDAEFGLFGKPPLGQNWDGAQTTIQRWDTDPLLDNYGEERTLRTIFTHDHLGPSTHQQAGLYAGLVVEPEGSLWYLPDGEPMNRRRDGGPTSWEGYVVTRDPDKSFREFALEFQDTQLAYAPTSIAAPSSARFDPTRSTNASPLFDVAQFSGITAAQVQGIILAIEQEMQVKEIEKRVIPGVLAQRVFPGMGIPLVGDETISPRQGGAPGWVIEVPSGSRLNAGATYVLEPRNNNNSLVVFTPGIKPGWSDPANALNPPGAGSNAGSAAGPPFAQLVSQGAVGTYSMNYRNESVIARLAPQLAGGIAGLPITAAMPHPPATSDGPAPPTSGGHGPAAPAGHGPVAPAAHGRAAPTAGGHGTARPTTPSHGGSVPSPTDQQDDPLAGSGPEEAAAGTEPEEDETDPVAAATIQIDGVNLGGVPTWVVGGQKATAVAVKPGDTVVWKAVSLSHGVAFPTEAAARALIDFETGGGLPPLGPQNITGPDNFGTDGQPVGAIIARGKVKAGVAAGTKLRFFCTVHGAGMDGNLTTDAPPAGRAFKVFGAGTTPPGGADPHRWELEEDGGARRSLTGAAAAPLVVAAGDTIEWNTGTGFHGVVFGGRTQAQFEALFEALPGGRPLVQDPGGQPGWGTAGAAAGTVSLRVRVKPAAAGPLGFHCSVHGPTMDGKLQIGAAPPPIGATIQVDGVIRNGTPTWEVNNQPAVGVMIKAGDTVVWRAVSAPHGVVFNTQAQAERFLQFKTGNGLPALGTIAVGGQNVWGTAPQAPAPGPVELARATVKDGIPPGTSLGFFCSQHGRAMSGSLTACGPPLEAATDPAFVFNSIPRNNAALNQQPVPGSPIIPTAVTLQVDGVILNGTPIWLVNGQKAEAVTVKPGDTIEWRAVTAPHGVVFNTEAEAEKSLEFETGGTLPALGPQTVNKETVWGTPVVAPAGGGTVIARAKVKSGVALGTRLGFFCTRHGRPMDGAVLVAFFRYPASLVNPSTPINKGGVEPTDPFTPLMRAYANDNVQVRVLVGAHTQAHSFQIQGVRWTYEPDYPNSGYKNAQAMGISEHFEMIFGLPPTGVPHAEKGLPAFADYLVSPSSSTDGLANGNWTMLRAFTEPIGQKAPEQPPSPTYLAPLPSNPQDVLAARQKAIDARYKEIQKTFEDSRQENGEKLPEGFRTLNITATTALKALGGNPLSFNARAGGAFDRRDALIYVRSEDLDANGRLLPDAPREPLILRVAAGDWVEIRLTNALDPAPGADGFPCPQDLSFGTPFARPTPSALNVLLPTSRQVGLHPALVSYDVTRANGVNVGFNPASTVEPGKEARTFYWYAGELSVGPEGVDENPAEYGAINLVPADMMVQNQFGMVGALIVEPRGSEWSEDRGTHASATVRPRVPNPLRPPFRDFVLVGQNLVANLPGAAWGAFNYRTEPFSARGPVDPLVTDSQFSANRVLEFKTGSPQPPLGAVNVVAPAKAPPGFVPERLWGTAPQPAGQSIAQAEVREGIAAGTKLEFFCSQHGRKMNGSLSVQAATADPPATIEIEGNIKDGKPTWLVNDMPANDVAVRPGDTVIWKAVQGQHGVVFVPTVSGLGFAMAFSNDQLTPSADPLTPIFQAAAGTPVRFRVVMPSTSTSSQRVPPVTFTIHGHGWPEEPFANEGTVIGGWPENPFTVGVSRPAMNWRSQFFGSQQIAPYEGFNFVVDHAGGRFSVPGDYLYEAFQQTRQRGMWGLFRVEKDLIVVDQATSDGTKVILKGTHLPSLANSKAPVSITVTSPSGSRTAATLDERKAWTFTADHEGDRDGVYTVESSLGGVARVKVPAGASSAVAGARPAQGGTRLGAHQ